MFSIENHDAKPEERSSPRLVEALRDVKVDENTAERIAKLTSSRAWDEKRRHDTALCPPAPALHR